MDENEIMDVMHELHRSPMGSSLDDEQLLIRVEEALRAYWLKSMTRGEWLKRGDE